MAFLHARSAIQRSNLSRPGSALSPANSIASRAASSCVISSRGTAVPTPVMQKLMLRSFLLAVQRAVGRLVFAINSTSDVRAAVGNAHSAAKAAHGRRSIHANCRHVRCRSRTICRCSISQRTAIDGDHDCVAWIAKGVTATAASRAAAMPSPVKGSMYPPASPIRNTRSDATLVGRLVSGGVPRQVRAHEIRRKTECQHRRECPPQFRRARFAIRVLRSIAAATLNCCSTNARNADISAT